jgi:hypothetical protein
MIEPPRRQGRQGRKRQELKRNWDSKLKNLKSEIKIILYPFSFISPLSELGVLAVQSLQFQIFFSLFP